MVRLCVGWPAYVFLARYYLYSFAHILLGPSIFSRIFSNPHLKHDSRDSLAGAWECGIAKASLNAPRVHHPPMALDRSHAQPKGDEVEAERSEAEEVVTTTPKARSRESRLGSSCTEYANELPCFPS